jgi:tRNA (guanine37-N1)-methyltransferase
MLVDAITRLLPDVLGAANGAAEDSYATGLLEHPHYTRPAAFREWGVPDVLRSGDHAKIARWRRNESLRRTWARRPDLLEHLELSKEDRAFLQSLQTD